MTFSNAQTASLHRLTARPVPGKPQSKLQNSAMTFRNVSKVYADGTCALDDISFEVQAGSLVAIVGASGCGKSTLLRLAAGLEPSTSGLLEVDKSKLGYVFQDATLLPWRTVLQNVELFAELHGVAAEERRSMALHSIRQVGLQGFEHHYPKALSGGMRMRASLARSMVLNPRVCLFDEPFGALDEISRERLHDELLSLHQKAEFTGLFITHSIHEAVYLASRVLVMSARPGRIVGDFSIDLPYPRTPEMRYSPEFASISQRVQSALRGACV